MARLDFPDCPSLRPAAEPAGLQVSSRNSGALSLPDRVPWDCPGAREIGFTIPERYNASAILFDNLAAGRDDRPAVIGPAGGRSYAQLAADAARWGNAFAALGLSREPGAARPLGSGAVFVDPRLASLGARAILPREEARALLTDAGLVEAEFDRYDRLRLSLGVPDGSRDLVLEKSILLEAGFDELNGVDWQKGCYIGQELTARTKYRGLVKKRLMPVRIEGPTPPPGTIVTTDGREIGEMRSSRDGLGLALLRIEPVREGKRLAAGEAALVPVRPAWMRLENEVSP